MMHNVMNFKFQMEHKYIPSIQLIPTIPQHYCTQILGLGLG